MLAADQDWRWSIVEAKGVRSQDPPQLPPEVLPAAPNLTLPAPEAPSLESRSANR